MNVSSLRRRGVIRAYSAVVSCLAVSLSRVLSASSFLQRCAFRLVGARRVGLMLLWLLVAMVQLLVSSSVIPLLSSLFELSGMVYWTFDLEILVLLCGFSEFDWFVELCMVLLALSGLCLVGCWLIADSEVVYLGCVGRPDFGCFYRC